MDCEKFESTLMDELYDELDELTSAASKRHVAGCARCASLLHGLSATRRIAVLERVEPPPGLEERILAATKEAQKVVPLRGRISRVVSWAGSWAMRPQTAMAAVFLLMIGSTSVLLLRARNSLQVVGSSAMVVTEQGAPAASAPADDQDSVLDPDRAAGAHGAFEARKAPAAPAPAATASSAEGWLSKDEIARDGRQRAGLEEEKNTLALKEEAPAAPGLGAATTAEGSRGGGISNAGPAAGAPPPAAPPAQAVQAPRAASKSANIDSDDKYAQSPQSQQAQAAQNAPPVQADGIKTANIDTAMASYRSRNYDEATRAFDTLAAGGNTSASLWAARSVRESQGCAAAAPRFDQVAARAYGTQTGYDATLEGGLCYKAMGQPDKARSQFGRLLTVPSHAARAQSELDAMSTAKGGAGRNLPTRKAAPQQQAPPPPALKKE